MPFPQHLLMLFPLSFAVAQLTDLAPISATGVATDIAPPAPDVTDVSDPLNALTTSLVADSAITTVTVDAVDPNAVVPGPDLATDVIVPTSDLFTPITTTVTSRAGAEATRAPGIVGGLLGAAMAGMAML